MSDIQSTFQEGIKKIQISQEILSLKEKVSQNGEKRLKLIISLGEKYYKKYRAGEIEDEEVNEISKEIVELDKQIYQDLKIIEEKAGDENLTCECGTPLTTKDKFCRSCGKKVEYHEKEDVEKILCSNCGEEIPADSKYCNCCGLKLD